MEFTYDGLVRYGFGFYNPNHAAALICAIMPIDRLRYLGSGLLRKAAGVSISAALICALAMTYSRAGMLALTIEAAAFLIFAKFKCWKIFLGIGIFAVAAAFSLGALGRISYDASAGNRLEIWSAGLSLFAANPLGVGMGNSGQIASAFLLPDGIECRTLVNAHLTLLCEFGILIALPWAAFIAYALMGISPKSSPPKFAAYIAFCGMLVSSSLASIFDFDVLFYPQKYEHFTTLNIAMQWLNLIAFCALGAFLCSGNFSTRRAVLSMGLAAVLLAGLFLAGKNFPASPKFQKIGGTEFAGYFGRFGNAPERMALFCDAFNLKGAWKILKKHGLNKDCAVAIRPFRGESLPNIGASQIILMGSCADFANATNARCALIKPPPHFSPEKGNISEAYLPKWNSNYDRLKRKFPNWREL